jgi:hypothetical protein
VARVVPVMRTYRAARAVKGTVCSPAPVPVAVAAVVKFVPSVDVLTWNCDA